MWAFKLRLLAAAAAAPVPVRGREAAGMWQGQWQLGVVVLATSG